MINQPAILVFADGSYLTGQSIGASGESVGELVFNTAMTGYQEMLTDPSYARQIITLTAAHVGNTGCNRDDMESARAWASGLVIQDLPFLHSNYRAEQSLSNFLREAGIVAISGIDTRALTHRLREFGSISACITTEVDQLQHAQHLAATFTGLSGLDLASFVSRQEIGSWSLGGRGEWSIERKPLQFHVVAYDFGVKETILRLLHDLGCQITLVPAKTPAETVLAINPDGVFLSNGPGDPMACDYAIRATQRFLEARVPLFCICLGFQILALASGAVSYKMASGHHGANHPVITLDGSNRVFITSQNHGFAIDEATLPDSLRATHRSLFDKSLQGIMHRQAPAFGFQGHPEASPGPHDISVMFDQFIQFMLTHKQLSLS